MAKKITSFDVARRAGVSQPTVSRALRNLPGASSETIARVRQAAAELSYIPSESGRALSMNRTGRVAVVCEELTNPYYPELFEPIRRDLGHQGLRTVLVTDSEDGPVTVEALADGSYDGVILTTTLRRSSLPRDLSARGVPHVLVNRILDRPESPSCAVDNAAGARLICELVAQLGHRRVASLQGPVLTSTARERGDAVRTNLRRRGIVLHRELIRRIPYDHDAAMWAGGELLDRQDRPTAIICANDVMALGVLSAARSRGLDVPAELTVIGFDDIPMAGWPLVALTTVRCDLRRLAGVAVAMLVEEMARPGVDQPLRRIPTSLIRRSTHAPPR